MRRAAVVLGLLLPLGATPALPASFELTQGLADVIAAESFCGLTYDQAAIAAFIDAEVAADDIEFTSSLKGLLYLAEASQKDMSPSATTAHCTQVKRLAKTYGFTS